MPTKTTAPTRRAIGIVRVSVTNGRDGPSFASPTDQRAAIEAACDRDGLRLLRVVEELDVSGSTPLSKRHGLREAIEAVEAGQADVLVAAHLDRMVRSLGVQAELVSRVEAAGGQVLALDTGRITGESAGQWISGTLLGAMAEYTTRIARERSGSAQARAVARGVAPYPRVPPGYERGADGVLVPDPATAPTVVEAFHMRAAGESIQTIRAMLAANGIDRSYHAVLKMLASRVVLGELHFGELENLEAHEAIVSADVWQAAQRVKTTPGRRPKSTRLLARLGVLRCASCDARMTVGTSHHGEYGIYRCPTTGSCSRRVTISAELVERIVVDAVKSVLADVEGRAQVEDHAAAAVAALDRAQRDLDAAFRAFAGFEGELGARERLAELRQARDDAQDTVDQLGSGPSEVIGIGDWDRGTIAEHRAIIRRVIGRAVVAPGRGEGRVTIELVGEPLG